MSLAPAKARLPFAPLESYLRSIGCKPAVRRPFEGDLPDELCAYLDISKAVHMKHRQRGLSYWQADELCTRADIHPSAIWPEFNDWIPTPRAEDETSRKRTLRLQAKARARRDKKPGGAQKRRAAHAAVERERYYRNRDAINARRYARLREREDADPVLREERLAKQKIRDQRRQAIKAAERKAQEAQAA